MSRLLDRILVIDVEATCWEKSPPAGEESEIIEIGICTLDIATRQRLEKESILIKPERSQVSEFCTKLTTLTQNQVNEGITFSEACTIFKKKYLAKERIWASYGDYDRKQWQRQCESRQIKYPFSPSHINVKSLFAIIHKLPKEVGMAEALALLNLPLEGVHHRGGDDAWNIGLILAKLLN